MFSRARSQNFDNVCIHTTGEDTVETVTSYKYLGIWVNDISNLVKTLKVRLVFITGIGPAFI